MVPTLSRSLWARAPAVARASERRAHSERRRAAAPRRRVGTQRTMSEKTRQAGAPKHRQRISRLAHTREMADTAVLILSFTGNYLHCAPQTERGHSQTKNPYNQPNLPYARSDHNVPFHAHATTTPNRAAVRATPVGSLTCCCAPSSTGSASSDSSSRIECCTGWLPPLLAPSDGSCAPFKRSDSPCAARAGEGTACLASAVQAVRSHSGVCASGLSWLGLLARRVGVAGLSAAVSLFSEALLSSSSSCCFDRLRETAYATAAAATAARANAASVEPARALARRLACIKPAFLIKNERRRLVMGKTSVPLRLSRAPAASSARIGEGNERTLRT